jgi:hypothetical protein
MTKTLDTQSGGALGALDHYMILYESINLVL